MSVKRARSERRRKARAERKRRSAVPPGSQQAGNQDRQARYDSDRPNPESGQAPPRLGLDDALSYAQSFWGRERELDAQILDLLAPFGGEARDHLLALLAGQVTALWGRGWTPSDVLHVVDRLLDGEHGDEAACAVVVDGARREQTGQRLDPRWSAQLESLGERAQATVDGRTLRTRLALTLDLVHLLAGLASIPETVPSPGSAAAVTGLPSAGLDERMLVRIRALLAKAESTDFSEEAEALTAKAQELLARHALDAALLDEPERVGAPALRRVYVDDPYANAKASIVATVARANRCRTVWDGRYSWLTAFGFAADLDALELLGTSLLVQATAAMAREGSRRDAVGRSRTRSFRRAFLFGFAQRIGQRLDEADRSQVAAASTGARAGALPVLAAREDAVEQAVAAAFPSVVQQQVRLSNSTGWAAGHVAGGLADLTGGRSEVRRSA